MSTYDASDYADRVEEVRAAAYSQLYFIHIPKAGGTYVRSAFEHELPCAPQKTPHRDQKTGRLRQTCSHLNSDGSHPPRRFHAHGNHVSLHSPQSSKRYNSHGSRMKDELDVGYVTLKPDTLDDYLTFAVVRNPFDLLVTMFSAGVHGFNMKGDTFKDRMIKYAAEEIGRPSLRRCLFHQVFDNTGACRADVLVRNEQLPEGLKQLGRLTAPCIHPNIPAPLVLQDKRQHHSGRANVTRRRYDYPRDHQPYYDDEAREMIAEKCQVELDIFGYTFDGPVDTNPLVFIDKDFRFSWPS